MKSVVALIVLSALTGCTYPKEMLVSSAFTAEEERIIEDAVSEWTEAADYDFELTLYFGWTPIFAFSEDEFESKDGRATMHVVEEGDYGWQDIKNHYYAFNGYTRHHTTWSIVITRQEKDFEFYATILHEFGHYFGHYHHNDEGLMRHDAHDGKYPCVDSITLKEMCDVVDCGPNAHPTCVQKGYDDTTVIFKE